MRYVLLLLALIIVLGTGGFVWLGWHGGIAPIAPPARASFAPDAIVRGARLAAIGDCLACHAAPDGTPFAGGGPVPTPFGTVYASNITPDRATGIGTWSAAAFQRAMQLGVDRAGRQLYPAFPYDHFTKVSDSDIADLYAYLMTRRPVPATVPPNKLPFPLDIRLLVTGWKLLFFRPGPFHPDAAQGAEWNRGAYLVLGLAHCGACHTPHNWFGAEESGQPLAGGKAQGWYAYPLNAASPAPAPWTAAGLYDYLRHGWQAQHGVAHGPMADVTRDLDGVPDSDLRAIATYVAAQIGAPHPAASAPLTPPISEPGEALYRGACAQCHDASRGPPFAGIGLARSTALHAANPINLANVVVGGIPANGEERAPIMPGFGAVLTNAQIGDLLGYLRARFGGGPPWDDVSQAVQAARATTDKLVAAKREAP